MKRALNKTDAQGTIDRGGEGGWGWGWGGGGIWNHVKTITWPVEEGGARCGLRRVGRAWEKGRVEEKRGVWVYIASGHIYIRLYHATLKKYSGVVPPFLIRKRYTFFFFYVTTPTLVLQQHT